MNTTFHAEAQVPIRLSLAGGGTDLPSYYERFTGFVIGTTIRRFSRVRVRRMHGAAVVLSGDLRECAHAASEVRHPIVREALRLTGIAGGVEIETTADVPQNSGFGLSSSFCMALVGALRQLNGWKSTPAELATAACEIEICRLGHPIGKQDQFLAASGGGLRAVRFGRDHSIALEQITLPSGTLEELQSGLLLAPCGTRRRPGTVLAEQNRRVGQGERKTLDRLHAIKEIAYRVRDRLLVGDLPGFGALLHEQWMYKRGITGTMTNEGIDAHYDAARRAGALGGRLMGAGGGGFFLFFAPGRSREVVRDCLEKRGLACLEVELAADGLRLCSGDRSAAEDVPRATIQEPAAAVWSEPGAEASTPEIT